MSCCFLCGKLVNQNYNNKCKLHSVIYFASPIQDYSSLNYLDIVVDAALDLTNSPENIGLKSEKPGTKVLWNYLCKHLLCYSTYLSFGFRQWTKLAYIIFQTNNFFVRCLRYNVLLIKSPHKRFLAWDIAQVSYNHFQKLWTFYQIV